MHWMCRCVDAINLLISWLKSSIISSSSHLSSNVGRNRCRACNDPNSSNLGLILQAILCYYQHIIILRCRAAHTLKPCIGPLPIYQSIWVVLHNRHVTPVLLRHRAVSFSVVVHCLHSLSTQIGKNHDHPILWPSIWWTRCTHPIISINMFIVMRIISHQNKYFGQISRCHFEIRITRRRVLMDKDGGCCGPCSVSFVVFKIITIKIICTERNEWKYKTQHGR